MPLGQGLSPAAMNALARLVARPSRAERLQSSSNDAAAMRQVLAQQFRADQQKATDRRHTETRNRDRNARADEIFQRQQHTFDIMERQNEYAMAAQQKKDAFRLQTTMRKRKTSAEPGGTQQPVARPASATLTSGQGQIEYSTAGGLTQTLGPGAEARQLRAPTPQPQRPHAPNPELDDLYDLYQRTGKGADAQRYYTAKSRQEAEPEVIDKKLDDLYRDQEYMARPERTEEYDPADIAGRHILQARRSQIAERIRDLENEKSMRSNHGIRRTIRDIDDVPQTWIDQAMRYAQEQGATTDAEFEQYMKDFLKNEGFDNVGLHG